MFDKGKAAVVVTAERRRRWTASRCTRTRMSAFIRGEGGWGGDRGPSGPQNEPPDRAPDHEVTYQTSPDQAFLYRLNGDRNPLHTDPSFAAAGGFDRSRSCTACAATASPAAACCTCCAAATRRSSTTSRAASRRRCMPGEALTVRAWETGDGEAVFTTSVGDRVVIDQGLLRYS